MRHSIQNKAFYIFDMAKKHLLGGPKVGIQCVVRFIQLRNLFRWLIVHLSHMYFGSYKNHSHSLMFNILET